MVQRMNLQRMNLQPIDRVVNQMLLYISCEKPVVLHLGKLGLTAGWLAG